LGQGRENAKTYLNENPDLVAEFEDAIRQESGLRPRVRRSGDLETAVDERELEAD
jgi:hypothetical protein